MKTLVDVEALRSAVQDEYAEVAERPGQGFHFHTGRRLASILEYRAEWLEKIPEENLASFAGVGNPFIFDQLEPGERVVDVGSGAGLDSLIAGQMVGAGGHVVGVDMTPAMLKKARRGAEAMGASHVEFRSGLAEAMPIEDGWADVVISNGVVNLCPDKDAVWREIYRVLKPGGRIQIADIVVAKPVPEDAKEDIALWTGWIAGALLEAETEQAILRAGFAEIRAVPGKDVFTGAPSASSAAEYGTRGIQISALKPR